MQGKITGFETVAEFLEHVKEVRHFGGMGQDWYGGIGYDEIKRRASVGDNAMVAKAEKYITRLESSLDLPMATAYRTVPSVFGARLQYGEYIAGTPTCFRRKVKTQSDTAPIRIYVGQKISAGLDFDVMAERGAIITAFLAIVSRYRPVDLYTLQEFSLTAGEGYHYMTIHLESRPINLSQVGFVIGHPGFFRYLGHCFEEKNGVYGGPWPKDYRVPGYAVRRGERLGLTSSDLVIPAAHGSDSIVNDPEKWVKTQLQELGVWNE